MLHILAACMVSLGHMYCLLLLPAPVVMNTEIHGFPINMLKDQLLQY